MSVFFSDVCDVVDFIVYCSDTEWLNFKIFALFFFFFINVTLSSFPSYLNVISRKSLTAYFMFGRLCKKKRIAIFLCAKGNLKMLCVVLQRNKTGSSQLVLV